METSAVPVAACPRCNGAHGLVACPYVKAVVFHELTGLVTRVEFLTPAEYSKPDPGDTPPADGGNYPRLEPQAAKPKWQQEG